ncbi:MAG: transposase [Planctomycetota bacterium]|nr:transposase [Planctomycetota bacterium]
MARTPYPTDLSDNQWQIIAPFFPKAVATGRKKTVDTREIVNAIFYINRSGCQWDMLPHDFPNSKTVNHYYNEWRKSGLWKQVNDEMVEAIRLSLDREESPSVAGLGDASENEPN